LKRIAILFSGNGTNFSYLIDKLHKKDIDIVVALTNNPHAKGIKIARKADIPLILVDSAQYSQREEFDTEVAKQLQKYSPDLTVLAGFMRILTPVFTEQIQAINLHPSLLPRHKGLNAILKSYEDNYPTGGVSIHYVTSELDGGDIILQKEVSKKGLSFEEYDSQIRQIEKETLAEAVKILSR